MFLATLSPTNLSYVIIIIISFVIGLACLMLWWYFFRNNKKRIVFTSKKNSHLSLWTFLKQSILFYAACFFFVIAISALCILVF